MGVEEIRLTSEFRSKATKSILSIILFAVVYLILIALATGLTVLCVYAGFMIITNFTRIYGIILGIGVASLGVMILFFLLKFIFSSNKTDRSYLHKITKKDEPVLFELIENIADEVGTKKPKNVYLSQDVNAAVFYNSNFWSMFFPVRKNLQIGMGLVNTVTVEELRAILAHEFGHFSQRTMKVGSYVYNVNQVLYNMLYDNDSYNNLMNSFGSTSNIIAIFVGIAIGIIKGIQKILQMMYELINMHYLGLSREMEFHADEIAANVSGSSPLAVSLLRMNLADTSYNTVISYYQTRFEHNEKSTNIFEEQKYVMDLLAKESDLPYSHNLPEVKIDDYTRFNKSKLVIEDQWASHPSTEDRIAALEKLNIPTVNPENSPASSLFQNIDKTQRMLTEKLFSKVEYEKDVKSLSFEEFKQGYDKDFEDNSFDKIYNGYYDNKQPLEFQFENIDATQQENISMEQLFSDEIVDKVYISIALQNDINVLGEVGKPENKIKSFDYDGKKYERKACYGIKKDLQAQLDQINEEIKENDIKAFLYFIDIESKLNKTPKLKTQYERFFHLDKETDEQFKLYTDAINSTQFISETTPFETIHHKFAGLRIIENQIKSHIKGMLENPLYEKETPKFVRENLEKYLSKDWTYFGNEQYYEGSLTVFFEAIGNYSFLISRGFFIYKKQLLDYQAALQKEYHELVRS